MNIFFVAHVNNGNKLSHSKEQVNNTALFLKKKYKLFIGSRILSSNESVVFAEIIKKTLGLKKNNKKVAWLNYRNYAYQNSRFEITDRILKFVSDKKGLRNLIIIARVDNIKTILDVLIEERNFCGNSIPLTEYKHGALFLVDRNREVVEKLFEPSEFHN